MSCLLTQGRLKNCDTYNAPGVENETIYLANFSEVSAITQSGNAVSAITMSSGSTFFRVEFDENPKVTVTEEVAADTNIITQTIAGTVYGDSESDIDFYDTINKGSFIAIVVSNRGEARVLGVGAGLKGTASYSNADTLNGAAITLTATGLKGLAPVIVPASGTVTDFINNLL